MKSFKNKNRFLYLSILAFVFISTSALAVSGQIPPVQQIVNPPLHALKTFPPNPVLAVSGSFPIISAQGALAVDLDSGTSLYEKNPDAKLLPASTTKIVTALVAFDSYSLDQIVTIGKINVVGQKMGLFQGEKISIENLLYGLLVFSANDAAEALADSFPGGSDAFIAAMNAKAKDLSMANSVFQNPAGIDGVSQITTAKDLVRVSEVAMRNPTFSKIVGTKSISFSDVSGKIKYNLKNINQLLGVVPGVLGVKTGWTENARENLVTYIERGGHKVMIAVLGSQDRFGETRELIDWIFANYKWEEVKLP
ncbi:MAG: D-alanyl-D-alanine carboxypeptidase [Candidatus Woesebacteria bacterium]|nr:D-alanyl-D-alanine carboxypeptidase [Candidatus Woesebacteria bacterium]